MGNFFLALIATGVAWLFIKGGEATAAGWREGKGLHRGDDHPDGSPRRAKWNERWHAAGYTANQLKTGLPDARHALATGWRRSGSERAARRAEFANRANRATDRANSGTSRATDAGRAVPSTEPSTEPSTRGSVPPDRATEPAATVPPASGTEPSHATEPATEGPARRLAEPTPIHPSAPTSESTANGKTRTTTPNPTPRSINPSTNNGTTTGGSMSMPTGEVTNYDGHIAQYDRLIEIYQRRVEAAEETIRTLTGASSALDNLDSGTRDVHMDAKHLGFIGTQIEANNADLAAAKAAQVSANESLQTALAMRNDLRSRAGEVNQVSQATGHAADARYHQPA